MNRVYFIILSGALIIGGCFFIDSRRETPSTLSEITETEEADNAEYVKSFAWDLVCGNHEKARDKLIPELQQAWPAAKLKEHFSDAIGHAFLHGRPEKIIVVDVRDGRNENERPERVVDVFLAVEGKDAEDTGEWAFEMIVASVLWKANRPYISYFEFGRLD